MFPQLSIDTSLYILSFLSLPDVLKLYTVSRDIRHFLEENETAIFHQLAILHRFVSPGVTLEDVVEGEHVRGHWLDGVKTWKALCRRCLAHERNWTGRGSVTEGGYLSYGSDVRWFRVDDLEGTVLAITETTPKRTLSVRALEDGRLLWSLPAVNGLDLSNGYLLLWRNNGGIEIWKRANDVVNASASIASPLREPSPLAATASQLKQSPFALDAKSRPRDLRGIYLPHGFLPSFTGAPFRITRFKAPWLAVVDVGAAHVIRLYDVEQGTLLRSYDLDAIIQEYTRGQQPTQFVLLDIDISDECLCACFDAALVVVPIREKDPAGSSAGAQTPALVYMDHQGPFEVKQIALQLVKSDPKEPPLTSSGGTVYTRHGVSVVKVSGADALEVHNVVSPTPEKGEEISRALVRPSARWTSGFVSARFSPDGRHLIAGTVFSLLYLLPDFSRLLRGIAKDTDVVQKLHVNEPVRDLVWDVQRHRIALRTEPGDTFIVDLNPGYHTDTGTADPTVSFEHARLLRLRDFSSLYGAVCGNLQMRQTGVWFVWDIAQMHEDVRNRVKEQGNVLAYGPRMDGRPIHQADLDEKAVSVCFVEFADRF